LVLAWLLATAAGGGYYHDASVLEIAATVGTVYAIVVLLRAIGILALRTALRRIGRTTSAP
jgi:hypothetical protein